MKPKYSINDTIESDWIVGWVRAIYTLHEGKDQPTFVYGIEEPESEAIYYLTEEQLTEQ